MFSTIFHNLQTLTYNAAKKQKSSVLRMRKR